MALRTARALAIPTVFLTVELQSAFVITAATLGLFSFYYDASAARLPEILASRWRSTAVAVGITLAPHATR